MTPTLCWVFLLALVGRATSVPRPLVVDACALLCNPGAETESERERDPVVFPRYPKVNCKLQSDSDEHQAWIIASHCLKLCNPDVSIDSEVNCFALRGSLQANLGCFCEALSPLSPNTMRLHESWRLNFLVKELASDILSVILSSPLDTLVLCDIRNELFKDVDVKSGSLYNKCKKDGANATTAESEREKREVKKIIEPDDQADITEEDTSSNKPPSWRELTQGLARWNSTLPDTEEEEKPLEIKNLEDLEDLEDDFSKKAEEEKLRPPEKEEELPTVDEVLLDPGVSQALDSLCKSICKLNKKDIRCAWNPMCNDPKLHETDA
ncbi:uncharacterized protein LOC112465063 [Temnothorax curvispinosus]|uniref:Uncharacterized protein LOC112465063 n=1 Tax=Temnothorax curvispinosus TaxID=300111 RepID=A0A6J1R254_9HYME|nr:uncharacterized protein LOC112465063 [Temnothorax curvispinosus]